jgi:hypothetical protein
LVRIGYRSRSGVLLAQGGGLCPSRFPVYSSQSRGPSPPPKPETGTFSDFVLDLFCGSGGSHIPGKVPRLAGNPCRDGLARCGVAQAVLRGRARCEEGDAAGNLSVFALRILDADELETAVGRSGTRWPYAAGDGLLADARGHSHLVGECPLDRFLTAQTTARRRRSQSGALSRSPGYLFSRRRGSLQYAASGCSKAPGLPRRPKCRLAPDCLW